VEIGQIRLAGNQETAPHQGTHSVKHQPEPVNRTLCGIAHPDMLLQLPPEIYALLKGRLTFKDAIESPALTLMSRHQRHRIARFNMGADLVIFVGPISSDTFSLALVSSQDFTSQETCPTESATALEVVVRPWSEAETFRLHFRLPVLA